jgi:hypothetical protein
VRENTNGEETSIDLETLFNAVVANPRKVTALFETASTEARNA